MGGFARIDSVDTLKELRVTICGFARSADTALDETSTDIQRTLIWLRREQSTYWQGQLRTRTEQFNQAKGVLKRKKDIETSPIGGRYSFVDEKKAFDIAKTRLEEAEHKMQNVQRWIGRLEKLELEYKSRIQGLYNILEREIPKARSDLDKMIDSLEAYAGLAPPEAAGPTELSFTETPPKAEQEDDDDGRQ